MDNTKFIQKSAKASFKRTSGTMCLNYTAVMITIAIILMSVALISSSIVAGVDAKPSAIHAPNEICLGAGDSNCFCSNDVEHLTATCCATTRTGSVNCETCDIDTKTGDYVNCEITIGLTRGGSNLPGAPHHGAALADHGSAVGGHD
jgi:hypothetical protein